MATSAVSSVRHDSPTRARNASSSRRRGVNWSTSMPASTSACSARGPAGAVEVGDQALVGALGGDPGQPLEDGDRAVGVGVVDQADRDRAAGADDLLDRALGDLLPLGHDDDVAAGLLDLAQQVAGDDHRAAGRGVGAQHLAHRVDLRRVEPVGRLVEHEQVGQAEHRLRDRHPLAHALAVAADRPVDGRAEAGDLDRLVHVRVLGRPAGGRPVEPQVVAAGQVRLQPGALDERAEPGQHRRARAGRVPEDADPPLGRAGSGP